MSRKFRRILGLVILVGVIFMGYTVIFATEESTHESYEIASQTLNGELKDACYLSNGKLLLITGTSSKTRLFLTDVGEQSVQELAELQGSFRQTVVLPDRIIVACDTAEYTQEEIILRKVKLFSYFLDGFTPGNTEVIQDLPSLAEGGFAASGDGRFYFLREGEPTALYTAGFVSENESEVTRELVLISETLEPVKALVSAPNGESVYGVTESGGLWKVEASSMTPLSGASVGQGFRLLSPSLAVDGQGEVYRISGESLTVQRLYSSQSLGAACQYQGNFLADFDSVLLVLDDAGSVLAQVALAKRYPEFLFSDEDMIYSVSSSNNGVKIEYTNQVESQVSVQEFTEESGAFLPSPAPGTYSLNEDFGHWTVALNPEQVNPGRGDITAVVYNETTEASTTWTLQNGLRIDGMFLIIPMPDSLEAGHYRVEITNLCTSGGLPAKCVYTLTFTASPANPSQPPQSSGLPDFPGPSASFGSSELDGVQSSSSEEAAGGITSQIYSIDPQTGVMTGPEPGSTLAQVKENLEYQGELVVRNYQGTRISSGVVGTGTVFVLLRNNVEIDRVTLLMYGDLTGDGSINEKDVEILTEHEFYYESRAVLKELFLEAADVNRDGGYTFDDLNLLYKSIYDYRTR